MDGLSGVRAQGFNGTGSPSSIRGSPSARRHRHRLHRQVRASARVSTPRRCSSSPKSCACPLNRVRLVQCDTSVTPDQGTTSGQQSHPTNFNHTNLALPARRRARRWSAWRRTPRRAGVRSRRARRRRQREGEPVAQRGYGELIGGQRFNLLSSIRRRKRKHPREWTVLGTPVPRVDMRDMVTGRVRVRPQRRVPGMLHGRVVRPPEVGATVGSVDEGSVERLPGIVKVVVKNNFVGVVAEKPWQAMQAAERLKVTWTPGPRSAAAARLLRASEAAARATRCSWTPATSTPRWLAAPPS